MVLAHLSKSNSRTFKDHTTWYKWRTKLTQTGKNSVSNSCDEVYSPFRLRQQLQGQTTTNVIGWLQWFWK